VPELAVAVRSRRRIGTSAPWWLILPEQFVLVACTSRDLDHRAGAVLPGPELRWCRAVGVAYPVLAVAFMLTGGKPYYLAAYFPPAGPGAQPAVDWAGRAHRRRRPG